MKHEKYTLEPADRPNNEWYRCECGWKSWEFHDGQSYGWFQLLKHQKDSAE